MSVVTVFHNTTESEHWLGYRPGHRLVAVVSYEDAGLDLDLCERAYRRFNEDLENLSGPDLEIARRYRTARNRSLSVGDVIAIKDAKGVRWYCCAMAGWTPIKAPMNEALSAKADIKISG
jgi:hypothetical protein